MSTHVLLNLLNELRKREPCLISLLRNKFNPFSAKKKMLLKMSSAEVVCCKKTA